MAQPINIVRTASGVSFSPAQLSVKSGTSVFWVNMDPQAAHQVVQAPGQEAFQFTGLLTKQVQGAEPAVSGTVIVPDDGFSYALSDDSGVQGSVTVPKVNV